MSLNDYIVILENLIPVSLADTIIKEYKDDPDKQLAKTTDGNHVEARNCQTIGLSLKNIIDKNETIRKQIDRALYSCAGNAIAQYKNKFPQCNIERDDGYELLEYKQNQFYVEHIDFALNRPRSISCSFALNDDYEGGEFSFFDGKLDYSLKKGSAILFPSNFMFPHQIKEVTKGVRYSIITWFV